MRKNKTILWFIFLVLTAHFYQNVMPSTTTLKSGMVPPGTLAGTSQVTTGYLNKNFASNQTGTSFIPFTISGEGFANACTAMTIDTDGNLVLAGTTQIYDPSIGGFLDRFAIARFLPSGILDTTLINRKGTSWNGTNYIDFNLGVAPDDPSQATCITMYSGNNTSLLSYIQEPPIHIAVGGYSRGSTGHTCFAIAGFNSDGTLDKTFNTSGAKPGTNFIDFNISGGAGNDQATCITTDPQTNLIYLGGWSTDAGGNKRFALACFTPDGKLNTISFNRNGTRPGTTFINSSIAGYAGGGTADDQANCITILRDIAFLAESANFSRVGRTLIVLGGYSKDNNNNKRFAIAIFNTDGSLCTEYNNAGTDYLNYSIAGATAGNGDDEITCIKGIVYKSFSSQRGLSTDGISSLYKIYPFEENLDIDKFIDALQYANQITAYVRSNDIFTFVYYFGFAFAYCLTQKLKNLTPSSVNDIYPLATTYYKDLLLTNISNEELARFLKNPNNISWFCYSFGMIFARAFTENYNGSSGSFSENMGKAFKVIFEYLYPNTKNGDLAYTFVRLQFRYLEASQIIINTGGFSKNAAGDYRFAMTQFSSELNHFVSNTARSSYVPFSISGAPAGTGNDRVTGITTAGANSDIILGGWTQDAAGDHHFACADFLSSGNLNLNFGKVGTTFAGTTYIQNSIIGAAAGNTNDQSTSTTPMLSGLGFYLGGTSINTATTQQRFAVANYAYPTV